MKWVVGIDEVGRGPIAGPVTVCALMVPAHFYNQLSGQFDSKKLKPTTRENIARDLRKMRRDNLIHYRITSINHEVIDKKGIVYAVNKAIAKSLKVGHLVTDMEVLLDGGLRAPAHFKKQRTIIRGDSIEPIIGLASVLAKVHRDHHMTRLAVQQPNWGFEKHKGYGTKEHYRALAKHGPSPYHRRTYM